MGQPVWRHLLVSFTFSYTENKLMLSCSWVDGNQLFIMKSAKNKCRKIIVMISADLISVQRRWQKWQLLLNLNTTSPEMCHGIPNCTTQTALVWFTHQLCTMRTCIISTVSTDIWKAAGTATVANVISLAFPSHTKNIFIQFLILPVQPR